MQAIQNRSRGVHSPGRFFLCQQKAGSLPGPCSGGTLRQDQPVQSLIFIQRTARGSRFRRDDLSASAFCILHRKNRRCKGDPFSAMITPGVHIHDTGLFVAGVMAGGHQSIIADTAGADPLITVKHKTGGTGVLCRRFFVIGKGSLRSPAHIRTGSRGAILQRVSGSKGQYPLWWQACMYKPFDDPPGGNIHKDPPCCRYSMYVGELHRFYGFSCISKPWRLNTRAGRFCAPFGPGYVIMGGESIRASPHIRPALI